MSNIKGGEYPLSKIFSSEFVYNIPSYQRKRQEISGYQAKTKTEDKGKGQ